MTAALALVAHGAGEESAALWAAYKRSLESAGRSALTISGYQASVMGLAAHAGVPLDEITRSHAEAFLAAERRRVKRQGHASRDGGSTAAAHFRALRAFYTWCAKCDLIDKSPMRGMEMPATTTRLVPVPQADQIKILLASMDGRSFDDRRDTAIIRLACELGGPRRAELAGIKVTDVDLKRGGVLLHGKGGKDRWVPFGARTGEALLRYLTARKRHPLAASPMLWLGARGKPLTGDGIMQMVARRSKRAGTGHIHPHMFRHYAAAAAKRNRVPTASAKALFGWSTSHMYDTVYGRAADAEDAARLARELALGDQL